MADLMFINDDRLRAMIERDRQELGKCLEYGLCKSTMLLAGSITEAVLVDYFLTFGTPNASPNQVQRADLHDLVEWAVRDGVITERTKELTSVIRGYRNLIHPGREKRDNERVDIHAARVAASLTEMVLDELAVAYKEKRGHTAQEVLHKLRVDASALSILDDVLARMPQAELVKLYHAIPASCEQAEEPVDNGILDRLVSAHATLKAKVDTDLVRNECHEACRLVRVSTQQHAMLRLRFSIGDLRLLNPEDRQPIIGYLLDVLARTNDYELSQYASWSFWSSFGEYLEQAHIPRLERSVIDHVDSNNSSCDRDSPLIHVLEAIAFGIRLAERENLLERLTNLREVPAVASWAREYELIPF